MKETVKCPNGCVNGYIGAFAHVANGVCFCCNGKGTIEIDRAKQIAKLSDYARTKADWVMRSTEEDYVNLSYAKLSAIRNFCHGGWGLQEAYPDLLNHFREVGAAAFFQAQDEKLSAYDQ